MPHPQEMCNKFVNVFQLEFYCRYNERYYIGGVHLSKNEVFIAHPAFCSAREGPVLRWFVLLVGGIPSYVAIFLH